MQVKFSDAPGIPRAQYADVWTAAVVSLLRQIARGEDIERLQVGELIANAPTGPYYVPERWIKLYRFLRELADSGNLPPMVRAAAQSHLWTVCFGNPASCTTSTIADNAFNP